MTTRPSKTAIAALLAEYGVLKARRISVEQKFAKEMEPHKQKYEKLTAPILAEATRRAASIDAQLEALEGQIKAQLMAGVDQSAGTVALSEVVAEVETTRSVAAAVLAANKATADALRMSDANRPLVRAVASVDEQPGIREIDPEQLYNYVTAPERIGKFWAMFKVLIKQAEEFLGKNKVNELAQKQSSFSVSISLKP